MVVFGTDSGLDLKMPGKLADRLTEYDGEIEQRNDVQANLTIGQFNLQSLISQILMLSKDKKNILSLGGNRIGIHRVTDYTSWKDDLKPRTEKALHAYKELKGNESWTPKLLVLRYINQIKLPVDGDDVFEYINISPPNAKCLPEVIHRFNQNCLYQYDDKTTMNLVFASMKNQSHPHETSDIGGYVMDFELKMSIEQDNMPVDDMMAVFQLMREKQYEAFNSLITDKYKELIK